MKLRLRHATLLGALSVVGVALSLGGWARPAMADPTVDPICSSAGTALSGMHGNLTISGNAYVAAGTTLTVNGDLTLAPGACLDAFSQSKVTVTGNVLVNRGAEFALGCTPFSVMPPSPCPTTATKDIVGGSITGFQPLGMHVDGDKISGSVISYGGGDPTLTNPALSFDVKDDLIGGTLILTHWMGAWIGALRDKVGGNMLISNNVGTRLGGTGQPDSTEIAANSVLGNLICLQNTPAAQIGDSGMGPNTVFGRAVGECVPPLSH